MQQIEMNRRGMMASLATAAMAAAASPAAARASEPGFAALQGLIDSYVAARKVPGAMVAIVRRGGFRPIYLKAGSTAWENGAEITPDTLWRIYSMTKPITAMAVMQQVAAGNIGIDTPIADVLPEFVRMQVLVDPAKGLDAVPATGPILVRHLLTHTAGFSYAITGNGPLEREYRRLGLLPGSGPSTLAPGDGKIPDLQGFLTALAGLPLWQQPGKAWRYSVALDVAGGMLERLTGKPFDRVLADQLFAPLGMGDTSFEVPASKRARLSTNYAWITPDGKPLAQPVPFDTPAKSDWLRPPFMFSGGGGLVGSTRDYTRFVQMLLNEGLFEGRRVMAPETVRLALSNLLPQGVFYDGNKGYAAGGALAIFDTRSTGARGAPVGLYAWGGAAGTKFQVDPVRGVAVVVMLQFTPSQRFPLDVELQEAMNRDLAPPARVPRA
jgi:CubicO group peptidase (beta-lactamase class C family)